MEDGGTVLGAPTTQRIPAAAIDASRTRILEEIGEPPDLTLVRGVGNRGDDLIWAGTRELLADHIYREVDMSGLCAAAGHTVVLSGGGAWCRPFHDLMPRALAIAELRFERVIVLPSSFDPSEDEVRDALSRTRATVFARERHSYRRITSLCDARIAHDCAFFFDFAPWLRDGQGTLNAFRTDPEARVGSLVPPRNDDISFTAPSLEHWLETIASHQTVRTDRAHVMIAGALLGKQVEFAPTSYHKLDGIADYALSHYRVTRLAPARPWPQSPAPSRSSAPARRSRAQVTAVVLSRDRPAQALRAIDSLRRNSVSSETLVIDNNSSEEAGAELAGGCATREAVLLRRLDRNLGCAGGRQFALESVGSEYVLFLDDDAELEPGALDLLVGELAAHPECSAVTATVLLPDGTVHHSGGSLRESDGVVGFSLTGLGESPSALPATGPAGWMPVTAALIRREVLEEFPIETRMSAYGDNEWSYRVGRARPGSFRRSLEARAVHHFTPKHWPDVDLLRRAHDLELLHPQARFHERHRVLLEAVFDLVPELTDAAGVRDQRAARLLMELLLAKGIDWTLMEWMNGNLDGLLGGGRRLSAQAAENRRLEAELAEQRALLAYLHERHITLQRIEAGGYWRLRRRLLPILRAYWWLRGRRET
jgi:glycosyltransferase involved in cell wall biosynthesis